MAAIVCHGLQSHLESQIVESRTLRLRLPSSKSLPSHSQQPIDLAFKSCLWDSNTTTNNVEENNIIETQTPLSSNPDNTSGWSFLEALSNVSTKEPLSQYVHPQLHRSSLALSPRSLELCTENLGNESGSDIVENNIDVDMNMNMNMLSSSDMGTREQRHPVKLLAAKKGKAMMNFPPPLTTIAGSESLRVRPHREDGRLVIEVTKAPPMFASCFHAERSHGRLRLRFLNNQITCFDPEDDEKEEEDVDDDDVNYLSSTPVENRVELGPINLTNEGFDEQFVSEMNGQMRGVEQGEKEKNDVGNGDVKYQSSMFIENRVELGPIIFNEWFYEEFENEMHGHMGGVEEGEEEREDVGDDDVKYQSSAFIENSVELGPISLSDKGFENGTNGQMRDVEDGEEEEEKDNVDDECERHMRMEKYERPRRCKEEGEHENIEFLLNWGEPLWVVTS